MGGWFVFGLYVQVSAEEKVISDRSQAREHGFDPVLLNAGKRVRQRKAALHPHRGVRAANARGVQSLQGRAAGGPDDEVRAGCGRVRLDEAGGPAQHTPSHTRRAIHGGI